MLPAILAVSVLIPTALAHHSIVGQYSREKPLDISGTVEGIEWINPHVFLYIKDVESGATYQLELNGLPSLSARGWTGTELPTGTEIEVYDAYLGIEEGSTLACCATIYDKEGYEYYTGMSRASDKEHGIIRKGRNTATRSE